MGRDMNDLQPIGVQHHSVVFAVRQMGQQLGMPGVVMSGQMQRFFIQWRDEPLADPDALKPGVVQAQAGDLAYRCVKRATELAMAGDVKAVATAPLNKEALHLAGHHYPGSDVRPDAALLYSVAPWQPLSRPPPSPVPSRASRSDRLNPPPEPEPRRASGHQGRPAVRPATE